MMDTKHTLLEALGIEIVENTAERCVAVMPVDHRTVQPFGYLHGGASVLGGNSGERRCTEPD